MSGKIHCPHCQETLDGANSPAQTALMCPYCGDLFSLGGGAVESLPAATGPATGVDTGSAGYPYYIPDLRRPTGLTVIGILGILLGGVLAILGLFASVTMLAAYLSPSFAEEMQRSMPADESGPFFSVGMWLGSLILLFVGVVSLWLHIMLLRRKETARRVVWGLSLFGLILSAIVVFAIVATLSVTEDRGALLFFLVILSYAFYVCIYLPRAAVKKWFAGGAA